MQAIITKYLPATATKGSRIKATCDAGSITISYPHELSGQAVHRTAAEALAAKLGWISEFHGSLLGGFLSGDRHCFVFNNKFASA
jgi:hypothetical protein